jgi:hypothetical protein
MKGSEKRRIARGGKYIIFGRGGVINIVSFLDQKIDV